MATLQEYHNKAIELENTLHMSGFISKVAREELRGDIEEEINARWDAKTIQSLEPYDAIIQIYKDDPILKDYKVAPLRDEGQRLNLLYRNDKFTVNGITPQMVARGANYIANHTGDLIFGLDEQQMSQKRYDEIVEEHIQMKLDNTGVRSDPINTKGMDKHDIMSFQGKLKQQVLDDLMEGNSPYMYKALIPRPNNQEGYYIGLFWHKEDQSPQNAQLIGAMMTKEGKKHVVTDEELVGASSSDAILEYLTSWFFDYNHKNVKELYKSGRKAEDRIPGGGRAAIETDAWYSSGPGLRALATLEGQMGEIEFQHAIKPLVLMMEEKAMAKFGQDYDPDTQHLDEEEAQDVLRDFMDEFERPYTFLERLPGSDVTVPVARWINNLWELDINLREIWN